ncbi:MAG: Proline 4-hydroxylase (includes Rps23 Pro-64 3,4-dihydroxylase Tpa1), contains SM-20 domain [Pelagibacterales bacterium]|nr:Proline 4-hydroxylase (includes Rps23 Pro-64 3,4-dihydroxylase Tpa1), contains SM-20 domain [Pelagibacterales bacterium]
MDNLMTNYDHIISKDFLDLNKLAEKEKINYLKAKPFPNIELNNLFNESFLTKVLNEFPDLKELNKSQAYKGKNEIKLSNKNYNEFPTIIKSFIDFLNSTAFLNFLQKLTSIKEDLKADPYLEGGGLHEIKKGGVLKIHTDFNRHPLLDLDRRVNVLIYLNKDWKDSYGGHLELWNNDISKCEKKIAPVFNKMAIFSTTDFSNHGHPNILNCPENVSRKSIALYYFSSGRPQNEVQGKHLKNRTNFKSRLGVENDAYEQKENFKNFLRNFKLYKLMKNFEKKYIRKNKKNKF